MSLEYRLLVDHSDDPAALESNVQEYLDNGWQLHGGTSMAHYKSRTGSGWLTSYAQAVVREKKPN